MYDLVSLEEGVPLLRRVVVVEREEGEGPKVTHLVTMIQTFTVAFFSSRFVSIF